MLRRFVSAAVAGGMLLIAQPAPAQDANTPALGTWINPKRTVKVETRDCSGKLCGYIVWANAVATKDAEDSGIKSLIGTQLLRSYTPKGAGRWQGEVYVPDMGETFYSTIRQLDRNHLKISGCILGGLFCKSQVWERA